MRLGVAAAAVDGALVPGDVEVVDGRIMRLGVHPAGQTGIAAAGFVDLQVNGFAGVDLLDADVEAYARAGEVLARTGVTAVQPTFITAPETAVVRALGMLEAAQRAMAASSCPRLLPAHLEGPFLSPDRLGTHPAEHRRDPDLALLERLVAAGPVGYVTLAPELPGALDLVRWLHERGIVVAAGHSAADAAAAHAAFDLGVRTVTHLFNAMRRFQPRDPGLAGAALAREEVVVQLIVDGHHLAPETVLLVRHAARGRLALVTDAIAAAAIGDGRYRLGEVEVEVRDGVVRRADGTLAGSALTMVDAVRNLHALGVPLGEALHAAAGVPAAVLGRRDLGRLAEGAPADLVVLDDDLAVRRTLVGGRTAAEA